MTTKYLVKFKSQRCVNLPKIIQSERNLNLIGNSSLYTHIPKIKSMPQIILKKKWWQLNIWPNFKAQRLYVGQKSFNLNEFQGWSVTFDYALFRPPPLFIRVRVAQSLVVCAVLCILLFDNIVTERQAIFDMFSGPKTRPGCPASDILVFFAFCHLRWQEMLRSVGVVEFSTV